MANSVPVLAITLVITLLLVQTSGYAIAGTWQSDSHTPATISITPLLTDQDGYNQYELITSSCNTSLKFKII